MPVDMGDFFEFESRSSLHNDRRSEVEDDYEETDDKADGFEECEEACHFYLKRDVHRSHKGDVDQVEKLEQLKDSSRLRIH